jgi:hypothetical protein
MIGFGSQVKRAPIGPQIVADGRTTFSIITCQPKRRRIAWPIAISENTAAAMRKRGKEYVASFSTSMLVALAILGISPLP